MTLPALLASQDAYALRAKLAQVIVNGGSAERAFSLCRLIAHKTGLSFHEVFVNAKRDAVAIMDA